MEPKDTFETERNLPSSVSLLKFAHARCKEIQCMQNYLTSSEYSTKLAFQKLPRHMRRRAMSHKVTRLPRRLREKHLNQMKKSGLPPQQKRPSRKYRRKPSNLLKEYSKRQSKIKWLSTHIWHAKRFHMITKWGYKLAYCPCDKAFKACYRASKSHCLLQDISFFLCIEITARRELIIEKFKKITISSDGLSIGSKAYASGLREGELTIYKFNSEAQALGKVQFSWKYSGKNDSSVSSLWIWCHVAFYEDIFQTLLECFNLKRSESNTHSDGVNQIYLKEHRTELSRFRLSGYLANSVVQNCFNLSNPQKVVHAWYNNNQDILKIIEEQQKYWKDLNAVGSVNYFSPNIIVPAIVDDPRLCAPSVRTKACPSEDSGFQGDRLPPKSCLNPLCDDEIRKMVTQKKISNAEVSKVRSQCLIPGTDLSEIGYPVPLTFIQRPGSRNENLGYSAGWDIILPSSWAQDIWVSLIMWGARSGGLREYSHNNFEMGKFDLLLPDTPAGIKEEESTSEDCIKKFFRKPPNRRTNFNKFNIVSPFKFNWKLLIENWIQRRIETYIVLRNRKILLDLQNSLMSGKDIALPDNCLVPVQIKCDKHVPKQFSIICLPNVEDLYKAPEESISVDPNQMKRAEMRKCHKSLLKRLRNRRKKAKTLKQKLENIDVPELIAYHTQMRKLWLPEAENIKNSCSREIVGFVKEGGFSFALGISKGLGFVSGAALRKLISHGTKNNILVRNTNSRCYFLGALSIVTDL